MYVAALKHVATEVLVEQMALDEEIVRLQREITELRSIGGEWEEPSTKLAEILTLREWNAQMRGGWIDCGQRLKLPHSALIPKTGAARRPAESFNYSFAVRFDKEADGYSQRYALLRTAENEYEYGQEMAWRAPQVPEPVIQARTAEELTDQTVALGFRQARNDMLLESLGRADFGSAKWRADFDPLVTGKNPSFTLTDGKMRLDARAALEAGIIEQDANDGSLRLRPAMAGTTIHEFPGDPGKFLRSPIFEPTDELPGPRVIVAADGNRYRLHDALALGEPVLPAPGEKKGAAAPVFEPSM